MLKAYRLVFRYEGRLVTCSDYKFNWLGEDKAASLYPDGDKLRRWWRTLAICSTSYTLALHRYLRHRMANYDYERHFGGVIISLRGAG